MNMHGASHPDEKLLFCIDYSLESGSFPAAIDFDVQQQQDIRPAHMASTFLPNYDRYSELPAEFDYSFIAEQAAETFTYNAYAIHGIPIPTTQQSLQYTHL